MRKDRLIVGILCIVFAAWTFLMDTDNSATAPAIGIAILGIVTVAIARKR